LHIAKEMLFYQLPREPFMPIKRCDRSILSIKIRRCKAGSILSIR